SESSPLPSKDAPSSKGPSSLRPSKVLAGKPENYTLRDGCVERTRPDAREARAAQHRAELMRRSFRRRGPLRSCPRLPPPAPAPFLWDAVPGPARPRAAPRPRARAELWDGPAELWDGPAELWDGPAKSSGGPADGWKDPPGSWTGW